MSRKTAASDLTTTSVVSYGKLPTCNSQKLSFLNRLGIGCLRSCRSRSVHNSLMNIAARTNTMSRPVGRKQEAQLSPRDRAMRRVN